jgi:signal transduction histidine kinase
MVTSTKQSYASTGPTLAFAFVVMGVFLSIFGTWRDITNIEIIAMVVLGTCYVFLGIYGFHICIRTQDHIIQFLYFSGQLLIGGALIFLANGSGLSPLLFIPIIGQTVVLLEPRPMIMVNGIMVIIYFGILRYFSNGWIPFWNSIPFYLAGQILLILFLQLVGDEDRIHNENFKLVRELEEVNKTLKEYSEQVEELTITRERNRMAREIHDGLGHYLTVINMQIQAAGAVMDSDPEKSKEILGRAMNQAQEALREIRKSISLLHEGKDDEVSLIQKLNELNIIIQDANITPNIDILGDLRDLPAQYEKTLLRTVQEGVQNCIKHSKANNVWILLDFRNHESTRLSIRDDGIGNQNQGNGFGLISLEERARILNGKFSYGNLIEGGFYIEIEVPA